MPSIGKAFELAGTQLKELVFKPDYMFEIKKYAKLYQEKEDYTSLSSDEKDILIEKIDNWLEKVQEEKKK